MQRRKKIKFILVKIPVKIKGNYLILPRKVIYELSEK